MVDCWISVVYLVVGFNFLYFVVVYLVRYCDVDVDVRLLMKWCVWCLDG